MSAPEVYLERLFITDKKRVASWLNALRKKVDDFEISRRSLCQFITHTLVWVIKSLQTSDLLSNEKREALTDFLSNTVILTEIADVLNMRMEALNHWTWGDHILLEQRRQINGQFHIHMHGDILQAIFLHYIGVKWSVFFKAAFLALRNDSRTWQSKRPEVPKLDRMRQGYFLGRRGQKVRGNLNNKRSKIQRKRYFSNQLLDHVEQHIQHNEGEEEADFAEFVQERPRQRTKQMARMSVARSAMIPTLEEAEECEEDDEDVGFGLFDSSPKSESGSDSESDDDNGEPNQNLMETKQGLLHILAAARRRANDPRLLRCVWSLDKLLQDLLAGATGIQG